MPSPEIEEFARLLVQYVRDAAIRSCDIAPRPNAINPVAKPWKEAARGGSPESIVSTVIPDVVDENCFYLLHAIDQEDLNLSFTAANGKCRSF